MWQVMSEIMSLDESWKGSVIISDWRYKKTVVDNGQIGHDHWDFLYKYGNCVNIPYIQVKIKNS